MLKIKENKIHTLQVSSLEDLSTALIKIQGEHGCANHSIALSVNSPDIVVRPFNIESVDLKELKNQLILDSVEYISLPANAIELVYQVFDSSESKMIGVYACYPKTLIEDYLKTIDQAGCIPIKIVPSIVAGIDSFLDQHKGDRERFCLFDFSKENMIYFAVFSGGHCDFLREIHYEQPGEIEHEVVQSLRAACAMSSIKKFGHIYFSGEVPRKNLLINHVKDLFHSEATHGYFLDIEGSLGRQKNVIDLNLIGDYTLSLAQRKIVKKSVRIGLAVCVLIIASLCISILTAQLKIKELKLINGQSDFEYAQDLERRLKEL